MTDRPGKARLYRDEQLLAYGQRLAASSHPATRAGAGAAATTGGIRIGCCAAVAVKLGLGASAICSFSSESSGAATRKASTSFSSLVSSSSFCRKTSYTFFILGTCVLEQAIKRRVWLRPAICQVKQALASAWVVIEAGLPKHHDGDQNAQDQDNHCQQIDMVRQPRFWWGHCVCQEGRHEFIRRHRYG